MLFVAYTMEVVAIVNEQLGTKLDPTVATIHTYAADSSACAIAPRLWCTLDCTNFRYTERTPRERKKTYACFSFTGNSQPIKSDKI